jgi:hypothetical protein
MRTSNNYHIISIRVYPSKYYLEKFHKHESVALKKFYEICNHYNKFFWSFFQKITGLNEHDFMKQYLHSTKECAEEYLHEKHNIKICRHWDAYELFLIPKKEGSEELVSWIFEELKGKLKIKLNKKTSWVFLTREPTTWKREHFKTKEDEYERIFGPKK